MEAKAPMVAVVRCNGTLASRPRTNAYDGYASCKVMASLYAGDTGCKFGCLGKGDCEAVCKFDAIHVDPERGIAVVDEDKCTACGACTKACPKGIIELRAKGFKNRRVCVLCMNKDKGAQRRGYDLCSAGQLSGNRCNHNKTENERLVLQLD